MPLDPEQLERIGRELVPARESVFERLQQEAHQAEPQAEDRERAGGGFFKREGRGACSFTHLTLPTSDLGKV